MNNTRALYAYIRGDRHRPGETPPGTPVDDPPNLPRADPPSPLEAELRVVREWREEVANALILEARIGER